MVKKRPATASRRRGVKRRPGQANQIRIVGGEFRGRRLSFPDSEGLRPTSDRTRETLFNWLQPYLPGASCLDLFAGSGALGFEAASRGADSVVLLERYPEVFNRLCANRDLLGAERIQVRQADALHWLNGPPTPFEIVFLDPPFADHLLSECCRKLESRGWLTDRSLIYLEWDLHGPAPVVPLNWESLREKRAGQVAFALYLRGGR